MKKELTEEQFNAAIATLDVGPQTIEIAREVLVNGRAQGDFVTKFGLTKGAVSQAVSRVWHAAPHIPKGYERVTAVLPSHQAFIVKKWQAEADAKLQRKDT